MKSVTQDRIKASTGYRNHKQIVFNRGIRQSWLKSFVQGLIGVLIIFAVWHYLVSLHLVQAKYFPSGWTIIRFSANLIAEPFFLMQILATLKSMLIGLFLATIIGVPLGLFLGRIPIAYRMTRMLVEMLRPIPAIALAPLAILLFGLSTRTIVFLVVWTSLWPILINTIYGVHNVDTIRRETARTFGFNRLSTILRVELPSSAPFIATGIRISIAIALSVAIAGEMVAGSGNGLGGWLLHASSSGSLIPVYSATMIAGILGYLLNFMFEFLEGRLFFWHSSFGKRQVQ